MEPFTTFWAIVPIKPLRRGKSRLRDVLNPEQRVELNTALLINTIKNLKQVPNIENVLVVSRDPEALAIARDEGAKTLLEHGSPELNVALTRAMMFLRAYHVYGVIVVPADLPLLNPQDVEDLVRMAQEKSPSLIIVPDMRHNGTNILLQTPPDLIPYNYGEGSFARHVASAEEQDIPVKVVERRSLSLDLDEPEDLQWLNGHLAFDLLLENMGEIS
jgi:2-phospho-L-lactate guanylyltransferase